MNVELEIYKKKRAATVKKEVGISLLSLSLILFEEKPQKVD